MSSDLSKQTVHISLAAFPGMRHEQSAEKAVSDARQGKLVEEVLGPISVAHIQLVPQNFGMLTESLADSMMAAYPESQFRLHANTRVLTGYRIADLSNFANNQDWFFAAAAISKRLNAPAYTAHSGYRESASLATMLANAQRVSDLFGCPVGVEGQYPTTGDKLLVSSWEEYQYVFESGVPYALDLSHLNIVAHKSGRREDNLVKEMLNCERCIEVHVSDNDGQGDAHQVCTRPTWWLPILDYVNHKAIVFSEGNHLRQKKVVKL